MSRTAFAEWVLIRTLADWKRHTADEADVFTALREYILAVVGEALSEGRGRR